MLVTPIFRASFWLVELDLFIHLFLKKEVLFLKARGGN